MFIFGSATIKMFQVETNVQHNVLMLGRRGVRSLWLGNAVFVAHGVNKGLAREYRYNSFDCGSMAGAVRRRRRKRRLMRPES
jgi:hypothetical protein